MIRTRVVFASGALALLAACGSDPPLAPYDLGATSVAARRPFAVAVDPPGAGPNLDSTRILVIDHGDSLVLADAQWPKPLPALVSERISSAIASPVGAPKVRLALAIRRFELIAERRMVLLDLDATVTDASSRATLRHRDFQTSAFVASTRPADVTAGFDKAFAALQKRIVVFAYDP